MSRRNYPTADLYEERERDFYRRGPRSTAGYEELDIDITRARTADPYARRQPEFLRDDYGRTDAGPLVLRDDQPPPRRPREREVEREEFSVKERSAPPRNRVREEETDITFKREERSGSRPARSTRGTSPPRGPPPGPRSSRGEIERDEFTIRRSETVPMPERPRRREYERDDIDFRRGVGDRPPPRGPPPREMEREEIIFRHEERGSPPRERSLPPPRDRDLVAREREELIVRRRLPSPSPSPSPPPAPRSRSRERFKEEIVIRRTERSPTPPPREPTPPPPPPEPKPEPPVLMPITRPPIYQEIHQEIITHHRHIDHGVIRARSPTPPPREPTPPPPPPPPPPKVREEELEIEIRRRTSRGGYEREDIIIERDTREPGARRRSLPPPESKKKDMWTEVTKDLVIRDAVEACGYQYEETEEFFYVMEYLKYEDVLQLVEISEDIRRERQKRIREIEWEREKIEREEIMIRRERERESDRKPKYDDRFYEREIIYDSRRGRK